MRHFLLRILVGLLISHGAVHAAPLTYDFTGWGHIFPAGGGQVAFTDFVGTVTIDVVGEPAHTGSNYAWATSGWVISTFDIRWFDGRFRSGNTPGEFELNRYVGVSNNYQASSEYPLVDGLTTNHLSRGRVGNVYYHNEAFLHRHTYSDLSWLTDTSFAERGLAPGGTNQMRFLEHAYDEQAGAYLYGYEGFIWEIYSFVPRRLEVPEPGVFMLFAGGVCACAALARRRRFDSADAIPAFKWQLGLGFGAGPERWAGRGDWVAVGRTLKYPMTVVDGGMRPRPLS